jgi:hypothetical protein
VRQSHKIIDHAYGDEDPEHREELTLLCEVGFAGLPDDVGNIKHRLVSGHICCLFVLDNRKE